RRHVKINATDIHYIGKDANELDEQVFFGFDPEAQPDYGMESEAYAELLSTVKAFLGAHKLTSISTATGISIRYLRQSAAEPRTYGLKSSSGSKTPWRPFRRRMPL